MKTCTTLILFFIANTFAISQEIEWNNPLSEAFPTIEGRTTNMNNYHRLPDSAEGKVRKPVWNLSKNSAGLMIRFRSNATNIKVRYSVSNRLQMDHMPATGVSGVDLYAINSDGQELWAKAERKFGDTITYNYTNLKATDGYHDRGREYRLYLPLYNTVEWLEIGIAEEAYFEFLPLRKELPILVYGTSIAHGACASRPGMAWTNILGRKMDRPLINLAFSGNGRLEPEVVEFINVAEAKIYILDCLPNLWRKEIEEKDLKNRISTTVRSLKEKHPDKPVLLVDHAGYTDGFLKPNRKEGYERVNKIQAETYAELKAEGISNLHYLSFEEIKLGMDDMVDGTHPNDLGMQHYAEAYEKKLRAILKEPVGKHTTTKPISQYREPGNYDWEKRHNSLLDMAKKEAPKTVLIANSIIHFWGGEPETKIRREQASWEGHFTPMGVRNYAYGWDRLENVLWRIYHGELDGYQAEQVVMMIGTNNLHLNNDEEIIEGLQLIIQAIKERQPEAKIIMLGILPRRNYMDRFKNLNMKISQLAGDENVNYNYVGDIFTKADGSLDENLFSDGLHPNKLGYQQLRAPLLKVLGKK